MTSVAFLVDQLFGPAPGGQGTYIRELIPALSRIDPSLQVTLFHSRLDPERRQLEPWMEQYRIQELPWSMRRAYPSWSVLGRPRLPSNIEYVDILHAPTPAGVPPAGPRQRSVVTLHDVAFLVRPDLFPRRWLWTYRAGVARAVRAADALIAVSQHTAEDVVRRAQADPAKVHVVRLAASVPATQTSDQETIDRVGVRTPYVLSVGTLEPRKNLIALVRAYRRLAARGFGHSLVLAGGWGWNSGPLKQELSVQAPGEIVVTGRVAPDLVDALYRDAGALVYPSLYEGFGLPVLEAMARGVPCIVSKTTSLPEVAGDAAVFVDPKNIEELASAIERVTGDPKLREDLHKRGLARAAEFSWDETARKTLDVYKSIL
ncbi:MAG TPA: glycosyltransferase family 1 protein [Actinomycetota bacterium]|nr:glycosyltransferase family 1 protein [Actinomycetota bacterium]